MPGSKSEDKKDDKAAPALMLAAEALEAVEMWRWVGWGGFAGGRSNPCQCQDACCCKTGDV